MLPLELFNDVEENTFIESVMLFRHSTTQNLQLRNHTMIYNDSG
jgi:hypothetical protein